MNSVRSDSTVVTKDDLFRAPSQTAVKRWFNRYSASAKYLITSTKQKGKSQEIFYDRVKSITQQGFSPVMIYRRHGQERELWSDLPVSTG